MNGYPYPPMMQVPYGYTNAVPMVPSAMGPGISTTTSMGVEYPQPSVIPVQYVPSVSTPLPPGFLPGVPYQQQPAVQGTLSNVYPQQQLPMQPMAAQQYAQQQWYTQQQQQQQQMYAQQQQQIYTQQQQQQQMYAQQQQQQQQQIYAQQQQQQWYAQQQQLQQNQQIYGSHMAPQALNNTTTASTSSYQICNPAAANPVLSPGTCAPVANTCQEGVFKVADATTVVNSGEPVMGVVLETAHSNTHNTSAPSNKVAIKQQPQQIPTPANRPGLPAVLPDGRSLCPQGKMCPAQYNTNHKKLFYHGPEGHLAGYLDPDTFFS